MSQENVETVQRVYEGVTARLERISMSRSKR
jgi:hypothetical protein